MLDFIITALAVYGLSSLLTSYDGLYGVFLKLRNKYPNSALQCLICTSFWVGLAFTPIYLLGYAPYLAPLAFVGIVILLEDLR